MSSRNHQHFVRHLLLASAFGTWLAGCGQSPPAPMAMPGQPAMPGAQALPPGMPPMPGAPVAAPAAMIMPGGPAQTLQVAAAPGATVHLTELGEYQIDAMGEPMDAELYLYRSDELVVSDRDSGGNSNARVVEFLQPGAYSLRVQEYRARPMSVRVQVQKLAPLVPVGVTAPGQPLSVQTPQAQTAREACREVTLNIATAGTYQIEAAAANNLDAELDIIQSSARLAHDSDSGGNRNARIRQALAPGAYTLRVWEYAKRAAQITITVIPG